MIMYYNNVKFSFDYIYEGLDGGRGGGGSGNSLISKYLAHYSLSFKNFCLFFKNYPLFFKMLIGFRHFLYESVVKVLFKAIFFCMTEMRRQTLAQNLNTQCKH